MEKIMSFDEFLARNENFSSVTLLFKDIVWFILKVGFFTFFIVVLANAFGLNFSFWYFFITFVIFYGVISYFNSDYLKARKDYKNYKMEEKDKNDRLNKISSIKDISYLSEFVLYSVEPNEREKATNILLGFYGKDKDNDLRIVDIFIEAYNKDRYDFEFLLENFPDSKKLFDLFLKKYIYNENYKSSLSYIKDFNMEFFNKFKLDKNILRKKMYNFFNGIIFKDDSKNRLIIEFLKEDIFISEESLKYFEYFIELNNLDLIKDSVNALALYSDYEKAFNILEYVYSKYIILNRVEIIKSMSFFDKDKFFNFINLLFIKDKNKGSLSRDILFNINLILNVLDNNEKYKVLIEKIIALAKKDSSVLNYILSDEYGYNNKDIEFLMEFQNSEDLKTRMDVAEKAMYCIKNGYGKMAPFLILEEMTRKEGENLIFVKKILNFLKENKTEKK